ncbi:HlyD family type I secretion periplasmic adaptor subunit [soil metagenome]
MTDVKAAKPPARPAIHSHLRLIAILSAVLVFVLGGWAAVTKISQAVVSRGTLVSASYVKKIQHPTGGTVRELDVQEGQRVVANQLLLRLDDVQVRAGLEITRSNILQLKARQARLLAEQAVATGGPMPVSFNPQGQSPEMAVQLAEERRLMAARRTLRDRQKSQLSEQVAGEYQQAEGLKAESRSRDNQMGLVNEELSGVRTLYKQGYAPMSTLKALERQAENLAGERGQYTALSAQVSNKVAELRMQALQIDAQHLSEVLTDLRDVEAKLPELVEKEAAQVDQLNRLEIRAPQAGIIHEMEVHTIGGVVGAGEPIMLIVPSDDSLTVETHVAPQNITEVSIGQLAGVKFVGLDRTAPQIDGTVSRIGADLVEDRRTGVSYYVVRIALSRAQVARLGNVKLVSGMPVETYIKTGDRTVLSYLMKPLAEQLSRSFRER